MCHVIFFQQCIFLHINSRGWSLSWMWVLYLNCKSTIMGMEQKRNCVLYFPTTVLHFIESFSIVKWPHCWRVGEGFRLPVIPQTPFSVYLHFLYTGVKTLKHEKPSMPNELIIRVYCGHTIKRIESPQTGVKKLNQVDRYLCTLAGGTGEDHAQ